MSKKKVFVVGGCNWYASFLNDCEIVWDLKDADIAIFTGGEDVNPAYYGAEKHPQTYFSNRDRHEIEVYNKIAELDNIKLILGICRGAQLLCVLNKGLLIQDVSNHAGEPHNIYFPNSNKTMRITSLHHQMLYPFNLDPSLYEIIAHSRVKRSSYYEGDLIDPEKVAVEPEIVLFKNTVPELAIQGHPEMMGNYDEVVIEINKLVNELYRF